MIINDSEAIKRLNSPMNLINKLKSSNCKNSAMSLFGVGRALPKGFEEVKEQQTLSNIFTIKNEPKPLATIPSIAPSQIVEAPTLNNILENNDSQIKLGLAHDNALALLNRSVDMLSLRLDEVKADKLPSVVTAASKVVEGIRKERAESSRLGKDREVHYHFYTPEQKPISSYEVIDVVGV